MSPRIIVRQLARYLSCVLIIAHSGCDLCGNDILATIPAPSGNRQAVVFLRSCGATTPFFTQVSVLPRNKSPKSAGNVFSADANHGNAPQGPNVSVRWLSSTVLEIMYDPRARVWSHVTEIDGIRVQYVTRDSTS